MLKQALHCVCWRISGITHKDGRLIKCSDCCSALWIDRGVKVNHLRKWKKRFSPERAKKWQQCTTTCFCWHCVAGNTAHNAFRPVSNGYFMQRQSAFAFLYCTKSLGFILQTVVAFQKCQFFSLLTNFDFFTISASATNTRQRKMQLESERTS